jgi:hypothetical protein
MTAATNFVGKRMIRKYNINFSRLLMLILDMSEEQQSMLLRMAQQLFDKRKNSRTSCLIPANYKIKDSSYTSFILDINDSGAFIETDDHFPIGKTIKLEFLDPFSRRFIELIGQIVWSNFHAIGVKFW